MKIENSTNRNTDDLRRLVLAGMRELKFSKRKISEMVVVFKKGKDGIIKGRATLGQNNVEVFLPETFNQLKLAFLIEHEFVHIIGLNHEEMEGTFYRRWKFADSEKEARKFLKKMKWALPYLNIRKAN